MANRFAWGDTLGAQLYGRSLQSLAAERERQRLLEEERQRQEAERRRQEEQRRKASDHGAFGQTLQTIGQVGGAIIGAKYGGTQGAIAGSQLGSAGASTIMNLFPNVGGTEPDGSNPYYDQPSDMARLGSTINTGLQVYGAYSKAAAAQAKQDLMDEIKADMQRNVNSGISPGPGAPASEKYFDYKNATASQISDRIKSLPSWQNATGLFGEQLVNDSAALSIANNTYDQISQSAMAGLQFIQGLDNNKAKQQALQNWQNTYGQSRAELIPKYGLKSMMQSVQSGMKASAIASETAGLNLDQLKAKTAELKRKIAKAPQDEANALYLQLAEINLKAIQAGAPYDANAFKSIGEMTPEIASAVDGLASAQATAYTKQQQAKTKAETQKAQAKLFEQALSVIKTIPFEQQGVRNQIINIATQNEDLRLLLQQAGPVAKTTTVTAEEPFTKDQIDTAQKMYEYYRKGDWMNSVDAMSDAQIVQMIRQNPNPSQVDQAVLYYLAGSRQGSVERSNTRSILEPVPQQQTQTVPENPNISNSISNLVTDAQSISQAERTPTAETPPVQSAPNSQSNTRPSANVEAQTARYLSFLDQVENQVDAAIVQNPMFGNATFFKNLIVNARNVINRSQNPSLSPAQRQKALDEAMPLLTRINDLLDLERGK